jgi:predicted transcriptional regulator
LLFAFLAGVPPSASAQAARGQGITGDAIDSLVVAHERAQWDALKAGNAAEFGRLMDHDVVDVDASGIRRTSPGSTAAFVSGCKTASYALADVRVARHDATVIITYKATVDQVCFGQKAPSPLYVMTVYERRVGDWVPIAHSETPAAHW